MGSIQIDEMVCKGCGLCVAACPLKIIVLSKDRINAKGYHLAELAVPERCTGCASCGTMCPDSAITVMR